MQKVKLLFISPESFIHPEDYLLSTDEEARRPREAVVAISQDTSECSREREHEKNQLKG
jgi:hypothetical protein